MEDLRGLMLTGRKVITENGKEYLVLRDAKTSNYCHQDFLLVNENGFLIGSSYDSNLKHNIYDEFSISLIYQEEKNHIGAEKIFSFKDRDYLVWKREWQPKTYELYYTVDFTEPDLYDYYIYTGDKIDLLLKERGLLFKSSKEAQAKAKEMLKI